MASLFDAELNTWSQAVQSFLLQMHALWQLQEVAQSGPVFLDLFGGCKHSDGLKYTFMALVDYLRWVGWVISNASVIYSGHNLELVHPSSGLPFAIHKNLAHSDHPHYAQGQCPVCHFYEQWPVSCDGLWAGRAPVSSCFGVLVYLCLRFFLAALQSALSPAPRPLQLHSAAWNDNKMDPESQSCSHCKTD